MKNIFLIFFFILPFALSAQDEVNLIQPIVESPSMNLNQAKAFSQFQSFNNWGIRKLKLDTIMRNFTGKGIKICICDTGRPDHSSLQPSIKIWSNFTSDETSNDGNGHSTHVAGIINEIAPDAELLIAKVLNNAGSGSNAGVASGIDWCVKNEADIINMSLGASRSSAVIKSAIQRAVEADVVVIAAVGNDGQSDEINLINYPARYEETLAVGSVNDHLHVSLFSSSGNEGNVVAPGESILSTWKDDQYIVLSGTSMATPFVSAVTALFFEQQREDSVFEDISVLKRVFNMYSKDIAPEGFDRYSFHGHVDPILLFTGDTIQDEPVIDPDEPVVNEGTSKILILVILLFVLIAGAFIWFGIKKTEADEKENSF